MPDSGLTGCGNTSQRITDCALIIALLKFGLFLPRPDLGRRAHEFDGNKTTRWGSKICSTTAADGDEPGRLVQCPLYSLHINFRSSNLSPGFEIA
jgi:hypothetical protein